MLCGATPSIPSSTKNPDQRPGESLRRLRSHDLNGNNERLESIELPSDSGQRPDHRLGGLGETLTLTKWFERWESERQWKL